MTTMLRKNWDEGDWIDFIVLRVAPAYLITLGMVTLCALGVTIKTVFWVPGG